MTEPELLAERSQLIDEIATLKSENAAVLEMWTSAVQDRGRLQGENRALRNELAMCPESRVEMAAWQPECTSDLAYLDAPFDTAPATAIRLATTASVMFWTAFGSVMYWLLT